jgi:RNA polymerase sigma-70 factor (ECF subfamily)
MELGSDTTISRAFAADGERRCGEPAALAPHDVASARVALEQAASIAGPRLVRVARRRLGSREDAEECVQDALLAACVRLDQLERADRLESWLRSIVVNACKMRLRHAAATKRSATNTVPLDDAIEPHCNTPCPEEAFATAEIVERLRRLVASRNRKHLRVLDALLDDADARDYGALASKCGLTRSAFKTRVYRLRLDVERMLARVDHNEAKRQRIGGRSPLSPSRTRRA